MKGPVAWMMACWLLLLAPLSAVAAPGGESLGNVVVATAPPYLEVGVLVDFLEDAAASLEVLRMRGQPGDFAGQLTGPGPDVVVAVGVAALPVRDWLADCSRRPRVVFVGAPHAGSVGAEVAFALRAATEVERIRARTGMDRNTADPDWAFPAEPAGMDYVVRRAHDLFEPLYHRYLLSSGMSLVPETSGDYLGWLARRYPSRLGSRFSDARPVGTPPAGSDGDLLLGLPRGYLDYVAARTSARTYYTMARPAEVLVDGALGDVPVGHDLRSILLDFLRRRATRFLGEYVIPQAARRAREAGLDWLESKADLDPGILAAQLPPAVEIPWEEGYLEVPVNGEVLAVPTPGGDIASVVVTAPNWWQLVRPGTGSNDWWTEASSASYPRGSIREVFLPSGGGLGRREPVARAVARELGLEPGEAPSVGFRGWLARGADVLMGLVSSLRPSARGENRDEEAGEEIPSITAIYRNKSTTLKEDRPVAHEEWNWSVDGEDVSVPRADDPGGSIALDLPGEGPHRVRAESLTGAGDVLRAQEWVVEEQGTEIFEYDTVREVVPEIVLEGPPTWVTGRPAQYAAEVVLEDVPGEVENLRWEFYPGREFEVRWERPGRFEVRVAVNLRYSWRFSDGTSRYISATYSERMAVEVFATGFEAR